MDDEKPLVGDQIKMIIVTMVVLLGLVLSIHYTIYTSASSSDASGEESPQATRPAITFGNSQEEPAVTNTTTSDERPVRPSRSKPRGRGDQIIGANGELLLDKVSVAVRDENGSVGYAPGDSEEAAEARLRRRQEDEQAVRLKAGSDHLSSTVPSDNHEPGVMRLPDYVPSE